MRGTSSADTSPTSGSIAVDIRGVIHDRHRHGGFIKLDLSRIHGGCVCSLEACRGGGGGRRIPGSPGQTLCQ